MPTAMSTTRLLLLFLVALPGLLPQKVTLSSRVVDSETGEYILGATVICRGRTPLERPPTPTDSTA